MRLVADVLVVKLIAARGQIVVSKDDFCSSNELGLVGAAVEADDFVDFLQCGHLDGGCWLVCTK